MGKGGYLEVVIRLYPLMSFFKNKCICVGVGVDDDLSLILIDQNR